MSEYTELKQDILSCETRVFSEEAYTYRKFIRDMHALLIDVQDSDITPLQKHRLIKLINYKFNKIREMGKEVEYLEYRKDTGKYCIMWKSGRTKLYEKPTPFCRLFIHKSEHTEITPDLIRWYI